MSFELQKITWFVLVPPASLLLLIVAGLVLLRGHEQKGRQFIALGTVLLYLLSLPQIADAILRPLERAYPVLRKLPVKADAVVVPGGGSVDLDWMGAPPEPNPETLARLVKGVELSKKLDLPLVLAGGNGAPFATRLRDADVMAGAALAMGMHPGRIVVENESRNTLENSLAVRRIVRGNRIVLVTSAYYMRRAVALFERRGFTVIPAPVYFMSQTRPVNPASLVPGAGSLACSSVGIAEWVSMAWWRLRGEI